MPNGSRSPWTTSSGTRTASSSASLLSGTFPPARRGGRSGNARQSTPAAPVASAVRHATRAPDERPPGDERRAAACFVAQLLDDRDPNGVELVCGRRALPTGDAVRLLDERDGETRRRAPHPSRRSRSRDCTPPPAPCPSTSQPRGDSACRRCTRASAVRCLDVEHRRGVCRPMSSCAVAVVPPMTETKGHR